MGNKDRGLSLGELLVFPVNITLRKGVQRRRGLVQDHHRTVLIQKPCHHQSLQLSAGELRRILKNLFSQVGMQALWQPLKLLFQSHFLQTILHSVHIRFFVKGGHILRHLSGQKGKILKHCRKKPVILPAVKFPDVDPVEQHLSLIRVVKPAQQLDQRGLSRPVYAYHRQLFSRMESQIQMGKNILFRTRIPKGYVLKRNGIRALFVRRKPSSPFKKKRLFIIHKLPDTGDFQTLLIQKGKALHNPVHPPGKTADRRKIKQKLRGA